MRTKTIIQGLAGLGLGAGLLIGCQTATGQKSDASNASGISGASAALLQLAIKDSGACVDLKSRCLRSHKDGDDTASLVTTLADSCIVDTAEAKKILAEAGFEWRGEGPGGRGEEHGGPRLDSAAAKALCDSLTTLVGKTDSADSGYAILKHKASEVCEEPGMHGPGPKLDSAAAKARCDSLTTVLTGTDTASAGYAAIKHEKMEACEERLPPMRGGGGFDRDRGRGFDPRGHH